MRLWQLYLCLMVAAAFFTLVGWLFTPNKPPDNWCKGTVRGNLCIESSRK